MGTEEVWISYLWNCFYIILPQKKIQLWHASQFMQLIPYTSDSYSLFSAVLNFFSPLGSWSSIFPTSPQGLVDVGCKQVAPWGWPPSFLSSCQAQRWPDRSSGTHEGLGSNTVRQCLAPADSLTFKILITTIMIGFGRCLECGLYLLKITS